MCALLAAGCQSVPPAPAFDPSILRVADILEYAPETFKGDPIAAIEGRGIAEATRRYKSHVAVVYRIDPDGKVWTLEARFPRVDVYSVNISPRLACVRRMPNADQFNKEAADQAVAPFIGKPYDVPGLFSFLLQPFLMPSKPINVCSTLSARYLRAGGLEPFNAFTVTDSITPGDFFTTGVPVTIWRNAPIDRARNAAYPAKAIKTNAVTPSSITARLTITNAVIQYLGSNGAWITLTNLVSGATDTGYVNGRKYRVVTQ